MNKPHPYEDILHRQRPVSQRHAPMSMADRAAQFAPFAALTGYEQVIERTARQVLEKRLSDSLPDTPEASE